MKIRAAEAVAALVIATVFLAPRNSFAPEMGKGPVYVYDVVQMDERMPGGLGFGKNINRVVRFTNRLTEEERGGGKVYVLERDELLNTGDRFFWTFVMEPDSMSVIEAKKKVRSRTGKVVRTAWVNYQDPFFDRPERVAHIYTVANMMQSQDLFVGFRCDCYIMLTLDLKPWHVFMTAEDVEDVMAPAGEFSCYRMRLELDYEDVLGKWAWGARLFRGIVPDYYFWMNTEPPYEMVRFEGRFGFEQTAPRQAWELVSVKKPGRTAGLPGRIKEAPAPFQRMNKNGG